MPSLTLEDFLCSEGSDWYVREVLLDALNGITSGEPPLERRFEFNLFDVLLSGERGVAELEDVLDASDVRKLAVDFATFSAALRA